jgi:hypothetical protein
MFPAPLARHSTALDLLGIPQPEAMTGRSIVA